MEIYNETGKTKTNELRVTRPIGALVVSMSQAFEALTNETITAFVERANGNNTELFTDLPLKALIGVSTAGNPAVFETANGIVALCELCEEGSIDLQETESIRIKMDGLKSGVTYTLNGLEYPSLANTAVKVTRKNILAGETERKLDVREQELMLIEGVAFINEMVVTFANGHNCKYVPAELMAISRDFDAVKSIKNTGTVFGVGFDLDSFVTYPLVGVDSIDIKKKSGDEVRLYLKNDIETFDL